MLLTQGTTLLPIPAKLMAFEGDVPRPQATSATAALSSIKRFYAGPLLTMESESIERDLKTSARMAFPKLGHKNYFV